MSRYQYILTDIEGTTTAVDFVYHTLFPYFCDHLPLFLKTNAADPAVRNALTSVKETLLLETPQAAVLSAEDEDSEIAYITQILLDWAKADRKHTGLKSLQGLVWKTGFENGQLVGHVYPDVLPALKYWKAAGLNIGIYSSGSIAAQQLLFRYSTLGDLTLYFSHYFDTTSGQKKEPESYHRILSVLGLPAAAVLFLSDAPAELAAAQAAGLAVCQLVRPGTIAAENFWYVPDFTVLQQAIQLSTRV